MLRPALALAIIALAAVPAVLAATTSAEAATYTYPLKVDDPAGDQSGPFDLPGDVVPETDILGVEVTDDAATLVFRVTMATMAFSGPSGTVTVTVQLEGAGGEAWEATVAYANGGTDISVGDYDNDQVTGDGDDLLPGARAEIVAPAIYIFADHSATGLALGDEISLVATSSGRGGSVPMGPGLSFSDLDTADVGGQTYVLAASGAAAAPPPPSTSNETASPTPTPSTTTSSSSTPAPPPAPPADPNAGSEDDTATGGFPPQEDDKDTPSAGVAVVGLALLVVALMARRRLD